MKILIQTILILLTITACQRPINLKIKETTETATLVKGNRFEGVIFSETMALDTVYEKRFTPTVEEIEKTETILIKTWQEVMYPDTIAFLSYILDNEMTDNRISKDYSRQYIGVINEHGDKEVHLNLLYKKVPQFVCMALLPIVPTQRRIDKKALSDGWVFPDNSDYEWSLFGGHGIFTRVVINLDNSTIVNKTYHPMSRSYDKNGNPKPFPY